MQNPINKEIRHYQEEIFYGPDAAPADLLRHRHRRSVLVYLTLEPVLGRETASWVCIVAAVPMLPRAFSAMTT